MTLKDDPSPSHRFLDQARKLVAQGISVLPGEPGEKSPAEFFDGEWRSMRYAHFKERRPTEEELLRWSRFPDVSTIAMLGDYCGVVAVDFDEHPELHPMLTALLPETPVKKRGVRGVTHFFRYSGEGNKQWGMPGEKPVVEILANHNCHLPPSVHHTGAVYQWVDKGLGDVDKLTLPPLPEEVRDRFDAFFAAFQPKLPPKSHPLLNPPARREHPPEDLDRVEAALAYLDPSMGYLDWVKVGMAIHSKFPGTDGFAAWDRWSSNSPKYAKNSRGEMNGKWRSFKDGTPGNVNIGTLFYMARERGFVGRRHETRPFSSTIVIEDGGDPAPTPPVEAVSGGEIFSPADEEPSDSAAAATFSLPEDILLSAPGLVGEIANWLSETNFYWQPSYSLAAALSFVGMLKGHNVCTEENSRTNLLTIAVGPSSSGKTIPLKRVQLLARLAGLSHRLCGEPMSEQGLVRGLIDAGHKAFIPWDEIGLAFKGMFSTYAPGFKAGIVRLILKIYSMADETILGFQYANNDAKTPRADLQEPCLCLYGTTTSEGIFGAFSSTEAVNGFAARLLIFETHDYLAERQPMGRVAPPEELVRKVRQISREDEHRAPAKGNVCGAMSIPVAQVVPYSPGARKLLSQAGRQFEGLKNKAIVAKRQAEESIWGRAYEQATKLALTVEDGESIGEESARWAVDLVTHLCRNMVVAARDQIADNQTHAELNSVLKLIKQAHPQWVDSTYLCRKTRGIPIKRRKELLDSLVDEGTVEEKALPTSGRKKTLYRYVR